MASPRVQFRCTWAGNKTISALSDVVAKRGKYLNETAFQSIHAVAIQTLKNIRSITKVAKPSSIRVDVTPRPDLRFSFSTMSVGAMKQSGVRRDWRRLDWRRGTSAVGRKMCVRDAAGVHIHPTDTLKFVYVDCNGVKAGAISCFEFDDEYYGSDGVHRKTYVICARSAAEAKREARQIVARRLLRFAGLAKRAISALMIKTNTRGPADNVSARVYAKANEVTSKRDAFVTSSDGSGKYGLILCDDLRYATSPTALKGEGRAAIDLALKKAANASIGLIRHKCKNLLLPGEIKTPFPEVLAKKKG